MWCHRKNAGLGIKMTKIFDLILSLPDGVVCIGKCLVLKNRILSGLFKQKRNLLKGSCVVHSIFWRAGETSLRLNSRNSAQNWAVELVWWENGFCYECTTHDLLLHLHCCQELSFAAAVATTPFGNLVPFAIPKSWTPLTPDRLHT